MRNTKSTITRGFEDIDAEGAAESIDQLDAAIRTYTNDAVHIFDANGDFRGTTDILMDMSKVWGDLNTKQQANLTTLIAGATQANTFTAIMENMSEGVYAYEQALDSAGSADKENARQMESIQGRLNALSSTWQQTSSNIMNGDIFKGVISGANSALSAINAFAEATNGIGPILATAFGGAAIVSFVKNFA